MRKRTRAKVGFNDFCKPNPTVVRARRPYGLQRLLEAPDGVGNVAHDLVVREVDLVDLGRVKVDVNHLLRAALRHEERRLLDHVVAHVDDQVGCAHQRNVSGRLDSLSR